ELIGGQIRMLQRDRRHTDEAVTMRRTVLRDFLVLQRDQIASQRAFRRVPPRIDVDQLDVDALGVHVDQTLRVAERDVAGQVASGGCRERRILHQVPDLWHERIRVNVDGLYTAAR